MTHSVDSSVAQRAQHPAHDILDLTPAEANVVAGLARDLAQSFRGGSAPIVFAEVDRAAQKLPLRIRKFLLEASVRTSQHSIMVRGNVIDDDALGFTPEHWSAAETPSSATHACMVLLYASLLGDVIGWESQQNGRIVTDVVPSQGYENSLISASSKLELGWHTEDAFSPLRADRVGLLCLRDAPDAATTVSYVRRADLSEEVLDILAQPRFVIVPDDAHQDAAAAALQPVALASASTDPVLLRVDKDFTAPVDGDEAAARALEELIDVVDANLYDVPLRPGDLCFLDNRIVVHGRRSFSPRFDGTDRWLKRVNVVADLRRVEHAVTRPGGRVIAVRSAS